MSDIFINSEISSAITIIYLKFKTKRHENNLHKISRT